MSERLIESSLQREDPSFEVPLRPQTLAEFLGQESIVARLEVLLAAAKGRKEALSHCLLCGPPGLGKTTLAHIMAKGMGTHCVVTSGAVIERPGDLAGILTNLQAGDILFIDEVHRLSRAVEEYLYPAMEDFQLDLMIDAGPAARSVQVSLNPFTLIGATTRSGHVSAPMRSRFGMTFRLDYYQAEPLITIVRRSGALLGLHLEEQAAEEIALRCRGTPRIANNLVRWVRDYAQIKSNGKASLSVVQEALKMIEIDPIGLDEVDKKILTTIIDHHQGGPVGLGTIAAAIGEESSTIEEVYEPYLMMRGLLRRTPRGREVTQQGYEHMQLGRE
ncbi:MAG: Holliday junction branch migration DNA helicase RuvB [Verrucomicrobia bacterium]|nr:Holliday junction branch migration DNA helicase RuvB [Verrucomicrobiota bacterium]